MSSERSPTEGDRVEITIEAELTELCDDGSGWVDADGIEVPFWPDELGGVVDE